MDVNLSNGQDVKHSESKSDVKRLESKAGCQTNLVNTVGQALQKILDENEIPQALVCARTGLSAKHVNFLVKDKAPLSVEVAVLIEEHFPQIQAFPLLVLQLRQEIAKVKRRRRRAKVIAPLDALDDPKRELLVEYAPGQE